MKMIIKQNYLLAILLLFTVWGKAQQLNKHLVINNICDSVYIANHSYPWTSNSLIVKASDKEIVLIDTPYETQGTALLLKWVGQQFPHARITAINTGFHIDNMGGNTLLREKGIAIYGADLTAKLIEEKGRESLNKIMTWLQPHQKEMLEAYKAATLTKPNITFAITEGLTLLKGELSFEVFYPGQSHSPDNVVVYIKDKKILFGGCMIKALEHSSPGYTGDANMQQWPLSVQKVKDRFPDAKTIIPHHGKWGNNKLLDHTIKLLKENQ
jgi:glyoxylase-like metal-dependent hydrolase (beta-lactamase superfamily II)